MGKTFNILSIDGGGILGLYSASVLEKIEKNCLNGKKLYEYFDLITGTSTGGIIALALASGKTAEEVMNFYKTKAKSIFPFGRRHFGLGMLRTKFSNKNLKKALDEVFEGKKIKDCLTKVCIPAVSAVECKPVVFKTNNNGTLFRDEEYLLTDVALCTSAAPSFFPLYSFSNHRGMVDGGLWQNNPCLIGLTEALSYFVGEGKEYDKIRILSIGNPSFHIRDSIGIRTSCSSIAKWNAKLVLMPMTVNSIGTDFIMNIFEKNKAANISKYLRLDCSAAGGLKAAQKLKLDSAGKISLELLEEFGSSDFFSNKQKIFDFFND